LPNLSVQRQAFRSKGLPHFLPKRSSTWMNRAALAATALVLSVGAGSALADVDQATKDAAKALWQEQQKAFDAHDVDGVLATFAESDDIMLMGTGPGEHWVGKAEIKDAFAHFIQGFDANTMEAKCGDGAGSANGDVAWFTAVCSFADSKNGKPESFVTNLSAVVVKQGDDWRFQPCITRN
jgi:ketosteroid isomerase-like protein